MGWFSKEEKVPEIPPAPQLPSIPVPPISEKKESPELPELPSFPAGKKNEALNNEIVKSAVSDAPEDNEVVVDMPSEDGVHNDNQESAIPPVPPKQIPQLPPTQSSTPVPLVANPPIPQQTPEKRTLELSPAIQHQAPKTKQIEPVFVRIDKFQEAQKDFDKIQKDVQEIESTLRKVKDIKADEEAQLSAWTKDLEKIKSRLSEIDINIFNKL
tara:strand:+ start:397 stop:1035 length:639 start_codon:yes stop_codon:yes gene_type:complete